MKIENLTKLARIIENNSSNHLVSGKHIEETADFLERTIVSELRESFEIAIGKLILESKRTNENFEEYLNCLDNIRVATMESDNTRVENMTPFIHAIGEARCADNAAIVTDLALRIFYNKDAIGINGETYRINPNDTERLEILGNIISQAYNEEQIHDVMDFYENHHEIFDANVRNILGRENLNGTKMAMNILKSYVSCDDIPYLSLRLMANGKDEYIPLMQALEENVAVERLQELQENFPGLDLPFEQYYVKRPKEKVSSHADDKNKSMVKGTV